MTPYSVEVGLRVGIFVELDVQHRRVRMKSCVLRRCQPPAVRASMSALVHRHVILVDYDSLVVALDRGIDDSDGTTGRNPTLADSAVLSIMRATIN